MIESKLQLCGIAGDGGILDCGSGALQCSFRFRDTSFDAFVLARFEVGQLLACRLRRTGRLDLRDGSLYGSAFLLEFVAPYLPLQVVRELARVACAVQAEHNRGD